MHTTTHSAAETPHQSAPHLPRQTLSAERAYQGLTIAFMFLLLASLWLFR
jgi:hypothetical protein